MENELIGRQINQFRITEVLGVGGMATVYKAYQASMDRYVALKILHNHFVADEEFNARFEQEARVIARLEHPNIVPIFEYGKADGYVFIAMRYVEGSDLSDLLSAEKSLPVDQVRKILTQVSNALSYAHSRGVVHRDVKPSNVLIDAQGNCFLNDFGFAKLIESQVELSQSGNAIGTPAYMSPEQIMGHELDQRSDIYALGIMLYEMLTGRPPYQAETPSAIFVKHITDSLTPPRTYNPDIPESLERVIFRALSKQPEDRYATVGEFVAEVTAALDEIGSGRMLGGDGQTQVFSMPAASHNADAATDTEGNNNRRFLSILLPIGIGLLLIALVWGVFRLGGMVASPGDTDVLPVEPEASLTPAAAGADDDNGNVGGLAPAERTATQEANEAATVDVIVAQTQNAIATRTQAAQPTNTPEPSETPTPAYITVYFQECRGNEGTIQFANFPAESMHAFSRLQYNISEGFYRLLITYPNNPDLNVDQTINFTAQNNYFPFGSDCR